MNDEKYNIICLSNQFYKNPGFSVTNKHIVMKELAKRGHNIIFVDPPTRFKVLKMLIKTGKLNLVKEYSNNFLVYTPVNVFNFSPFSFLSNKLHAFIINKFTKNNFKTVLWVYHFDFPKIFELVKDLNPNVFIYDIVDNYEAFPEYSRLDTTNTGLVKILQIIDNFFKVRIDQKGLQGKKWVKKRENDLAKRANLLFTSHPLLYKKFVKLNNKTYYTPNASLFNEFSNKPAKLPEVLSKIPSPKVLFSGSLDTYKVDIPLLIQTARQTPKINYALVGPINNSDSDTKVSELRSIANIQLVGPLPKAEGYCYYFDAYIIPYAINDYTYYGCFPTKFLNAAATGVPLVVTNLPAYKGFENIVYIAKDTDDFIKKVKEAVTDKSQIKKQDRIKVASQNTWEHKVDKQLRGIKDFLNPAIK